jgi:hypothetical protein
MAFILIAERVGRLIGVSDCLIIDGLGIKISALAQQEPLDCGFLRITPLPITISIAL